MLFALSSLAGAVAAVSGFGIGSLLTPFLLLTLPPAEAVTLVALPHVWATALRLYRLRDAIHWATFRQFGVASAVGGLGGALLQAHIASPLLTYLLAGLLILAGSAELLQRSLPIRDGRTWRLASGTLSGFFGGLVGNQGGIRAAALLGFGLAPAAIVATATATGLIVDAARVPVYLWNNGSAVPFHLPAIGWMMAGVTLGTFLGVPLLTRVPKRTYRRLVGGLLLILGIFLASLA